MTIPAATATTAISEPLPALPDVSPHLAILHPAQPVPDLTSLPRYVITATLAPPELRGELTVTLTNDSNDTLTEVVLRLYGNSATIYTGSSMEATSVRANGAVAAAQLESNGTALRIFLPEATPPGDPVTVQLEFVTEVATGAFRGYGIQQAANGIAVFGSPFPVLALRDGTSWRVPGVPVVGDAVSSPTALWDLFLTVPDTITVASTGEAVRRDGGRLHIVSGPARDFALVAMPPGATPIEQEIVGTRVRYWPAGYVGSAAFSANDAATVAARAVEAFSTEFGPPPYEELDIIEAQVPIGGYEYPGLVLFDGQRRAQADRDGIDFLVPHEIAHQWFYALVGNDVTREPWIDEGLATYAQLRYLIRVRGPDAASTQRARWEDEYATALSRQPVGVNRSLFQYDNWITYRGPTYYAAALLFDDLRLRLGDEGFREGIRRLVAEHGFDEATTEDIQRIFNTIASGNGQSLADFWPRWLEP